MVSSSFLIKLMSTVINNPTLYRYAIKSEEDIITSNGEEYIKLINYSKVIKERPSHGLGRTSLFIWTHGEYQYNQAGLAKLEEFFNQIDDVPYLVIRDHDSNYSLEFQLKDRSFEEGCLFYYM